MNSENENRTSICSYSTEVRPEDTTLPLGFLHQLIHGSIEADINDEDATDFPLITWECPHPAHESNEERCVFHLSEEVQSDLPDGTVQDTFRRRLAASATGSNQFIDARIPTIDLHHERIDLKGKRKVVLDGADIGYFALQDSEFPAAITGNDVSIGFLMANNSIIEGEVEFEESEIGLLSMTGARLDQRVFIHDSEIETVSAHRTTFKSIVEFGSTTISANANFSNSRFEGEVSFVETTIESEFADTSFDDRKTKEGNFHMFLLPMQGVRRSTREPDPDSIGASEDSQREHKRIHFSGRAFEDVGFVHFNDLDPHGADFRDATFERPARFDGSRIEYAEFSGIEAVEVSFIDTEVFGLLNLTGGTIERLDLRCVPLDVVTKEQDESAGITSGLKRSVRVFLEDCTVDSGRFIQPKDGTVYYDLHRATVGDIDVSPASTAFEHIIANKTDFEGFDFPSYRESLRNQNWEIDRDPLRMVSDMDREKDQKEVTYLKAKQGADLVGDTVAVSEFYRKEMRNRISQYQLPLNDSTTMDMLRSMGKLTANQAYRFTTGYGELPHRVVVSYFALTVGLSAFVLLPWLVVEPSTFADSTFELSKILLYGQASELPRWLQPVYRLFDRLVIPAFVALLVFTFSRSVER